MKKELPQVLTRYLAAPHCVGKLETKPKFENKQT